MLLNLSNHPSPTWTSKQRKAAISQYRGIHDIPFPHIEPEWTLEEVEQLAVAYCEQIQKVVIEGDFSTVSVHLMGELTFCLRLVVLLEGVGVPCVASTSRRMVKTLEAGTKNVQFDFVQFRNYF